MTTYPCPRTDLDCAAAFTSPGDLDWHFRMAHGYRRLYRIWTSLRPPQPIGPPPERHVPDGLVEGPGTRTLAERRADQAALTHQPTRTDQAVHAEQTARSDQNVLADQTVEGSAPDAGVFAGLRPSATHGATAAHRRKSKRHARSSH
ncbi:hypothetical protein MXD61_25345 [Frankia sp. AgPm24]|uniref:hypothetical protein n=1 Tax=Frankia sp. AgPm24 TaxID=631128 RepID=UPI0020104F47|nr:hypothetical protein [Frankia sp. AgPm24]MCK9925155.1 hypothetical protein [Frankia sp. AgPm24]